MSKKITFLVYSFFFLLACQSGNPKLKNTGGRLKYAQLLSIKETDTLTTVVIFNPTTKAPEGKFVLYRNDYSGKFPVGYVKIQIPVQRMAALSTTYIGMLDAIDALDCVKATTEKKYISNRKVLKRIESGKIITSGYEQALTPEAYLKSKIKLIVFSGFGQPFPNQDKLSQLEIPCLANYDWEESHPLGKAEWIKLFGALLDKQEEATAYFNEVESSYLSLKKSNKSNQKSKVLVGGMSGASWFAPAGESFMAGMLKDAGIDYCFKYTKGTASVNLTLEQVYKDQRGCSIWINAEGKSKSDLLKQNSRFAYFDALKEGKIYSYLHNPNYFWELSTVNPHWLLEDYKKINSGSSNNLHFYRLVE